MKHCVSNAVALALTAAVAWPALAHDCRVREGYLRGSYEGGCAEKSELAEGKGEARGADHYIGTFVKGRLDGKGVYTWENGARLDGTFKAGKAEGPGVYVSPKGTRYEGPFTNGRLAGPPSDECPATAGPLNC